MACNEQDHGSTKGKRGKAQEVDRISALPDSIVLHILSLLPTMEDVMMTGVLSKRWQYLWTSVPTLSFSQKFWYRLNKQEAKRRRKQYVSKITDILTQCHHTKLNKFKLRLDFEQGFATQINRWIRYVVGANVEELDLNLPCCVEGLNFEVPQHVFTNGFLTNLKLEHCIMAPKGQVNLKLLNKLTVSDTKITDDVFRNIVSGSPVLGFLELSNCFGFSRLHINSLSVRSLVLDNYKDRENDNFVDSCIQIYAPFLMSLDIRGNLWLGKLVLCVPSLIEAILDFGIPSEIGANEGDVWERLVQSLHNVHKLAVGNSGIKVLSSLELECLFSSLRICKCLKINSLEKRGFPGLANLLRISPNLESLSITTKTDTEVVGCTGGNYWASQNMEFWCLKRSLKTVKILYEIGWDEECELAQFLLEKAYVLDKMMIIVEGRCSSWNFSKPLLKLTRKMLLSIPRASKSADLLLEGFPSP